MMAVMKEPFLCRMPPVAYNKEYSFAFYLVYRKETLRCKTWTFTKATALQMEKIQKNIYITVIFTEIYRNFKE